MGAYLSDADRSAIHAAVAEAVEPGRGGRYIYQPPDTMTGRLAPLPMARVAPCPHCGQLPRSWSEMDMHLRFTCPVIRAPREGVAR